MKSQETCEEDRTLTCLQMAADKKAKLQQGTKWSVYGKKREKGERRKRKEGGEGDRETSQVRSKEQKRRIYLNLLLDL